MTLADVVVGSDGGGKKEDVLFFCMKLTHVEGFLSFGSESLASFFSSWSRRGMCWIRGVERSIKLMFPDSIVNRKKEEEDVKNL